MVTIARAHATKVSYRCPSIDTAKRKLKEFLNPQEGDGYEKLPVKCRISCRSATSIVELPSSIPPSGHAGFFAAGNKRMPPLPGKSASSKSERVVGFVVWPFSFPFRSHSRSRIDPDRAEVDRNFQDRQQRVGPIQNRHDELRPNFL